VLGDGKFAASRPLFGGLSIWRRIPRIVKTIEEKGALSRSTEARAQLHALLAPQDAR